MSMRNASRGGIFHAIGIMNCSLKECLILLQMKALAHTKDWEGLEAFAREKKSPIGIEPFIATAKSSGAPDETVSR